MTPAAAAAAVLIGIATAALVVPLCASSDPLSINAVLATRLTPPLSRDGGGQLHIIGTDAFGRDLLVRMMRAARISMSVGIAGSLLAAMLGVVVGAVAGWCGGGVDRVAMGAADVFLAVPRLVALLVFAALWGPGLLLILTTLSCTLVGDGLGERLAPAGAAERAISDRP
ncbi:MAG: hypothetical protein NVS9B3_10400 [Gemmatimonadaceae bacterium]